MFCFPTLILLLDFEVGGCGSYTQWHGVRVLKGEALALGLESFAQCGLIMRSTPAVSDEEVKP